MIRVLPAIVVGMLSFNLYAADFQCTGAVSAMGQKNLTVNLNVSEKTAERSNGFLLEIVTVEGETYYGNQAGYIFQDGKIVATPVRMIAIRGEINFSSKSKDLKSRSANGDFETFELSPGTFNANARDYLEVDRANNTARYMVADAYGFSVLECKAL